MSAADSFQLTDPELRFLLLVALLFALGALLFLVVGLLRPAQRRPLWRLYGDELLIVALVLLPVMTGEPLFALAWLALAGRAAYEWLELTAPQTPCTRQWLTYLAVLAPGALAWAGEAEALSLLAGLLLGLGLLGARAGWIGAAARAGLFPGLALAGLAGLWDGGDGLAWLLLAYVTVEANDAFALVG
ncbi:MAG TPA: hypothetical protein VIX81_01750, partial [Gammaproteobacteria bacterium]